MEIVDKCIVSNVIFCSLSHHLKSVAPGFLRKRSICSPSPSTGRSRPGRGSGGTISPGIGRRGRHGRSKGGVHCAN